MTESEPPRGAVSLSAAIAALRNELWQACWDGQSNRLKFQPDPVELTLQVAVTAEAKADAGVKWWLVHAGAELSRQSESTHTVKLVLRPVMFDQHGKPMDEIFIDAADDSDGVSAESLLDTDH